MDDDILGKVVEVEKEVQQRLDLEKKVSQEWLEKARRDAEEKVVAAEAEMKEAFAASLKNAKVEAEEKTAAIIKNAHEEAGRLKAFGDELLKKILLKHVSIILPGKYHDR